VKDVRAVDEEVFFKNHGASLPRARKLDKPSLRPIRQAQSRQAQRYGLAGQAPTP
jgi:hypothetical protein